MAQKKKGTAKKASSKPVRVQYEDEYDDEEDDKNFATTVKGVIAVMITFMCVVIVLMFTARSMFILQGNEYHEDVPTGIVTSTQPTVYEGGGTTAAEEDSSGKKKRTASPNAKDNDDGQGTTTSKLTGTTQYRCVSAVYLHPQPSADSENLLVIPQGAVVDVQKDENDWLYLDYNGTIGWAYGPGFFIVNQ
ncbi:MAG: SH3 domain-containing protein [Ruminococcus sp.]|nr:SH3 domain-containing protein [Ruminococcus sp.]